MIRSKATILTILCSLIIISICGPICQDTIPFSIKLSQSPLIVYGDIIETTTAVSVNNHTTPFNITFVVRCTLKGIPPAQENIIIEHTLPDNPLCYRALVHGRTYVFFLNQTSTTHHYKQMPYHELAFNQDATAELLKRTCGIQTRPFHEIIKDNSNEVDYQCPIVSIGCA
ncbi:unnamed protein product [Adineta ricciae]|uniref:Uncharacterized protein n=1 Tax=Adineta ricciae TaxID=249248 RepID=A0A813ZGR2_ADIRI|nr:unnamed protein product [Adineta ricciae]